ncbi:MAG: FixH family protein [Pseudomonadales bacterium]|jgi:hypothetical protein
MSEVNTRSYWPYALFSIPFAAVLFGIVMITTALYFPDDVVVDQYYKEGMAINERIADSEKAKALKIAAVVKLDELVSAEITGSTNSLHQLNFHHVTDENRDLSLNLIKQGERFVALESSGVSAQMAEPGVWYVELVGVEQQWRLTRRLKMPLTEFALGEADGNR